MPVRNKTKLCLDMAPDYEALISIPAVLFNAARMFIMQDLFVHGHAEFRELKANMTYMTDGNLAGHLRLLEKSGLIRVQKEIVGRRMRTSYEITGEGRTEFIKLRNVLSKFFLESERVYG